MQPLTPTTVSFPAGATDGATRTVQLALLTDTLVEGSETIALTAFGAGGQTTHVATITDDEAATISFMSASSAVSEAGASHNVAVRLTVTPGATLDAPVSATCTIGGGTATASVDYTSTGSATCTFPAGSSDGAANTVAVGVVQDNLVEGAETVQFALSGLSGAATFGAAPTHTVSITDDETCQLSFHLAASSTGHESGRHPVRVRRFGSGTLASDVTVTVSSITGGSATSGVDHAALSATVTFPAGSAANAAEFAFLDILPDGVTEGGETVRLALSAPSIGTVSGTSNHVVSIDDDDFVVSFSAGAVSTRDEAAAAHPVDVVLLTGGGVLSAPLSVQVTSTDGAARAGLDYLAVSGTVVTFPAGSGDRTARPVGVTVLGDSLREGDETLNLTLSNVVGPGAVLPTKRLPISSASWVEGSTSSGWRASRARAALG